METAAMATFPMNDFFLNRMMTSVLDPVTLKFMESALLCASFVKSMCVFHNVVRLMPLVYFSLVTYQRSVQRDLFLCHLDL